MKNTPEACTRGLLHIKQDSSRAAWKETLLKLLHHGSDTDNNTYCRDSMVVIEIEAPTPEAAEPLFPMSPQALATINHFIVTGADEDKVEHEWTKLYHHRIFDAPNSQIEYLISKLSGPEPAPESVISLWDKTIDQEAAISPCTLVIWARKKAGKLELHVHAHSSDAYKKLLMNLQEFIALHLYLAERVGIQPGRYLHVIDSCHIHRQDHAAAEELAARLAASHNP